ncbi:MAG: protein-glutamate O-methyltransferase CheR [Methanoregula sp.]|jgi:chemotaxis protein methyltransferase CheR|nr:protein-glutamate O-methyltransferase CheR [Methanoregula sp.]
MDDSDINFNLLKRHVEQLLKIQCSNYKEDYIKRRFLSRMRSTNSATYADYLRYLKSHPDENEPLRNALTINVTEFFRDKEVWNEVKNVILPALFQQKKRISIWCAGSSTGEEPYTLAILLHDALVNHKDWSGTITATDIDEVVLAKAKAGVFEEKAIQKLPTVQIQRHFTKRPDGLYEVKQHLKDLLRFRPHDLMSGVPPVRYVDLITCRNVTIYFTEKQKDDLAHLFHAALVTDGYYIMGKTEYLGRQVENLFLAKNTSQKVFIKREKPLQPKTV